MVGLWVVAVIALGVAASRSGSNSNDNLTLPGTDSQRATDLLEDQFPSQANGTNPIAIRAPKGSKVTDAKYESAIQKTTQDYGKDGGVEKAVGPFDPGAKGQIGKDQTIAFISLTLNKSPSNLDVGDAQRIIDIDRSLKKAGLEAAAGGYLGQKVSKPSTHLSEVVGIVAAMAILLLAFGSAVAMGVPLVSALLGLVAGLSIITILSKFVQVPTTAPALATMIGLGVGIDYALFVVSRHRGQLAEGMEAHESVARATATAGGAVVFAGGTVTVALLALYAAGIPLVTTLGYTSAIVVLIAVIAANTLLPAVLALLGDNVNRLRVPGLNSGHDDRPHGWARWANFVGAHPIPSLLVGLAILIILAIPALSLTLGQQDNGALPKDTQSRKSYDLMSAGFGPGSNGPLLIAVNLSKPAQGTPTAPDPRLTSLGQDISKTSGVATVAPPVVNKSGSAAVYTVTATTAPSNEATTEMVKDLRDNVLPEATKGQQMHADVGGTTAGYIDLADQISQNLPLVIGIVLVLSFILLLLAFRSVLVPLKAVVMNIFSILAAFGFVSFVFSHAWTAHLIGLEHTLPIVSFVPLMMFAILFGLSMDYEVFLMTHVRESWKASGDPHDAVVHGLAGTARVITSAALIMVSVFTAFVLSGDPTIKQFGLGMAVAVAVDATVVRCLLVPAIMSLLGHAGWWMPEWMEKATPSISIEGNEWFAEQEELAAAELASAQAADSKAEAGAEEAQASRPAGTA